MTDQLKIAVEALQNIQREHLERGGSTNVYQIAEAALKDIQAAEPPPEIKYAFTRVKTETRFLTGGDLGKREVPYQKLDKLIVVVLDPFVPELVPGIQKALRESFGHGTAILSPEPLQFFEAEQVVADNEERRRGACYRSLKRAMELLRQMGAGATGEKLNVLQTAAAQVQSAQEWLVMPACWPRLED